jgi:hypothetical protein
MIVWQADPGWDLSDVTRAPLRNPTTLAGRDGQPDGYQAILSKVRELTIDFEKPVVLVHGDVFAFQPQIVPANRVAVPAP